MNVCILSQVEQQIRDIPDLKYTVLRLATVYGLGDRMGLTPRIIVASIYKHLGETMKLLWNSDLKINTIHVVDVCRAIWFICTRDDTLGQVFFQTLYISLIKYLIVPDKQRCR